MRHLIFIIMGSLALAGCRDMSLYMVGTSGPPESRLGWEDGCDTGLSAQGGPLYKAVYGFQKRPEMANNELYKQAWNEGFTYCRFSAGTEPSFDKLGW